MRVLPIFSNGHTVEWATMKAQCYLLYPENEADAEAAYRALLQDRNEYAEGVRQKDSAAAMATRRALNTRRRSARLCGAVLNQIIHNLENRSAIDFNKAIYIIQESASRIRTDKGKTLPSDGRRLRKSFKEYRSALLFWAAFEILPIPVQQRSIDDNEAFIAWMRVSARVEQRALELGLFEVDQDPFKEWLPWCVPRVFHTLDCFSDTSIVVKDQPHAVLPAEGAWVREHLGAYRRATLKD
ncbi:MAG: hypothetical protein AAF714_11860 [Pseudomonadota bacterium]